MKPWLQYCTYGARTCLAWLGAYLLWTIWLGLALLLALQIYVASSSELAVPAFLLRRLEAQLAESGVRLTVGRTSFDPYGRVLLEDVRVSLPAFPEPVFTARALYVRLSPRALFMGSFEAAEIHLMHAAAIAPAQLTPSGRSEEILSGLEATVVPSGRELIIRQLSGRLGPLAVSARGSILIPPVRGKSTGPQTVEFLAGRFPAFCRQVITAQQHLARCDEPALYLEITPSASGAPALTATALARRVTLDSPIAAEADAVIARTCVLLQDESPLIPLELSAAALRLRDRASAQGLNVAVTARLRSESPGFELRETHVTVDALSVADVDARAISARVAPLALPRVEAEIVTRLLEAPLHLHAAADVAAGSARIRFSGAISPRVLDVVSRRAGTDVRRFFAFETLDAEHAEAHFGAGWKFERLTARVHVPHVQAYGVTLTDGHATVELEPGRLYSPEAFARVGENFARGTYEHNLRTQEYRFLLEGRLRPLAISPWFGAWWPNFFRQFEFPVTPPEASADVRGVWRQQGRQSRIFVFAEIPKAIIRGTELDYTRTRLFIRPGYVDGLEVLATRRDQETRGTFTYRANVDNEWQSLVFDAESSFELPLITGMLGRIGAKSLAPYRLAAAPLLKVQGHLHGPTSALKNEDFLRIDARTSGDFGFHDFPLRDVSFLATLKGGDVTIERFNGTYAEGAVSGNARVWSQGPERRLGFNVALENASLGPAATTLQEFLARRKGLPPPPPGRFVQERAHVQLNVAASGVGDFEDPFGFKGEGNATLKGAGIGQVPLLGLLSELFTFTSLRFTDARGNFKIEGPRLLFPKIELRGANSAIDAHGDFAVDRQELNFIARVFPFQESENVFKSVVGAVLTPLSNVLEVKLTGTLEKPNWAFVMDPMNLFRSSAEGGAEPASPAAPAKPAESAKPTATTPPATPGPTPPPAPEKP